MARTRSARLVNDDQRPGQAPWQAATPSRIGRVGAAWAAQEAANMLINVNIEQTQPLVGSASTGQERSVSFVGWLELLRVIADLAETAEHPDDAAANANAPLPTRGTTAARPA